MQQLTNLTKIYRRKWNYMNFNNRKMKKDGKEIEKIN